MVTIVSCCSLIGVSIMPLISGPSYRIFITLFTGLAVGSLFGSAIFSLIPQAFNLHLNQDRTPKVDKDYLWKSLMIFFGLYLFYISERLMRIYFDRSTRKHQQEQQLQIKKNKSSDSLNDSGATRRQDTQGDTNSHLVSQETSKGAIVKGANDAHSDIIVKDNQTFHHHHHHHQHHNGLQAKPEDVLARGLKSGSELAKGPPVKRDRVAPVAWMIIIGDGLHNFIDGLSIGAAFSESIALGVSTSLAVIFEEFPHELGDFAVLISSGMTVRQALGFNFLSACTCYIGMIFGILLGDMTQSASLIFALAGGMFLYISLVDMMGELSAMLEECKNSTREVSKLLLMQNLGILAGISIIFILSFNSNG